MKRVATAVVLIAAVLLAVFKAPPFIFTVLVALVALAALREYLGLIAGRSFSVMPAISYTLFIVWFGFVFAFCFYEFLKQSPVPDALGLPILGPFALVGLAPLLSSIFLRSADPKTALPSAALVVFGFVYIALPFTYLIALQAEPGGWLLLVFLFVVVWSGDIAALYIGRSFGKHKLAPRISPGKTWEGAIASFGAALVLGILWIHFSNPLFQENWVKWCCGPLSVLYPSELRTPLALKKGSIVLVAAIAGVTNVFSQLGDLFESAIKRAAEVKDSGKSLPGHGGVLDRVDALLFAAPTLYFCLIILFH